MKKLLTVALVFVSALTAFVICHGTGEQEEKQETKVYSFGGADELFSVSGGTVVLGDGDDTFYGGELKASSSDIFNDVSSCRTSFYIFFEGEKETVMVNEVTDITGGNVSFEGGLGKISSAELIGNETKNSDALINNMYLGIDMTTSDGTKYSHELKMNVIEVK